MIRPVTPLLRTLSLASVLAALVLSLAPPAFSQELEPVLPPKPLIRKFPQGQYCALPVEVKFTAPATSVVISFEAQVYVDNGSELQWTNQSIDNITLATSAQVAAHFGPPPPQSSSENCYIGDPQPVSYFHFNAPGLTFALFELCDTDPVVRGWDMLNGAYYNLGGSAPRDVDNDTDNSGGSIGLGLESVTPSASTIATTSVTVSNLTIGEEYDLGAWWEANFVRFPHDVTYLTVKVSTVAGTPVMTRSWGSIKSSYR